MKNLFSPAVIPAYSVSLPLPHLFNLSLSFAPPFRRRSVSTSSLLFLRVGAAELRTRADVSFAHFNWTEAHRYIFLPLTGHSRVCVLWTRDHAWLCRVAWPQKPRALAPHNSVLLQGFYISELELASIIRSHTWGWQLLSKLVKH